MDNNAKLRPLYLAKILYERTDEDHYLTTMQLAQILEEEYGIPAHRQTIKTDIELLQQFGMYTQELQSPQARYNLISRQFEIAELKLLIDAVQSSKFISKERSEQMVSKIVTLAGQHKAEELKRNASVEGRVKSENRQDLLIVDAINEAINVGVKISFYYSELNGKKKEVLRNDVKLYTVSPFDLIWDGDYYYLTDYCDEREFVRTYRVDQIKKQLELLTEKAVKKPKGYNVSKYTAEVSRMFSTDEAVDVTLLCDNCCMNDVVGMKGLLQNRVIIFPTPPFSLFRSCSSFLFIQNER